MEPCVYFYITQRRGQDASWAFLTKRLPISLHKTIGTLLMNSPNLLTSKALVTRFSIAPCPCDRLSHRPTPASLSPSFAHATLLKPCDRSCPSSTFSPCDRNIPSFRPCDRQNISLPLPKCKTLSLRRESGKRSACLSTVPSAQTFAANWPNETRYHFRLSRGLLKFAEVPTAQSLSPQRMPSAERSFIASCPTPAAGATA